MKTTIDTITTEKGRPADANVIWFHHVKRQFLSKFSRR